MTITLPSEIEKIVAEKVRSGEYQSVDEVISSGIRLLEGQEKGTEALRKEIMRGFNDIQEGKSLTFSSDEELEIFSDDIIRQAKERRDDSKK